MVQEEGVRIESRRKTGRTLRSRPTGAEPAADGTVAAAAAAALTTVLVLAAAAAAVDDGTGRIEATGSAIAAGGPIPPAFRA